MKRNFQKTVLFLIFFIFMMISGRTYAIGAPMPHETCISDVNGYATIQEGVCDNGKAFMGVMEKFVTSLMGVSGAIAVAMIVYGGFRYIMAAGDPRALQEAKSILFYSALGMFVVLSAYLITSIVFNAMS